jgi:putative nucleotidyltransferase with HDIG domain
MVNKKTRVLVVDDEPALRTTLEKVLNSCHFKAITAKDVKHAQEIIALGEADLVISDIKMPDLNGIQFLHWIKATHPMPVILMTGFSEILETKEAARIGADGFLAKPFRRDDLLEVIAACLPKPEASGPRLENLDAQFCKIGINDFVSGKQINFDIYIRISEHQYVKIAHSGEDLPAGRIQRYRDKDIKFLYMTKADFRQYLSFSLNLASLVSKAPQIDAQKKVEFIRRATETFLQRALSDEIGKEEFIQTSALVENTVSLLLDHQGTVDLLDVFANHSDFLLAHAVAVSFYSCLIGRALGWQSHITMFKLAMGGLLHDIGKKEIPRELLAKRRCELTAEDILQLETHPTRGAEILRTLDFIPGDVIQIVHEHHENCLGVGYPSRIKKSRIHPLAKVVALANAFCHQVIPGPDSPGLSPSAGLKKMLSLNPEYYDAAALDALKKLFPEKAPAGKDAAIA